MNLYLKHRPKSFKEFIGNADTINSLLSILERKDPPHAILFTGPKGTGKTTLARLTRKALGCSDYDYKELDAADFRGIDHIREIRKQMRFRALEGKRRVWLLDEAHQLSKDAQNALLKALEDTPEHVYFLLATTDPKKLLPTVRDRCSIFTVDIWSQQSIYKHLRKICHSEKKKVPVEVLKQIARDSLGGPRAALVILDKIIDLDEGSMLDAAAQQAAKENEIIELCRALMNSNWKDISKILKGLDQDPEGVRRAVLGYFSAVLINSGNVKASDVLYAFRNPFYDIGRPGLVLACYEAVNG